MHTLTDTHMQRKGMLLGLDEWQLRMLKAEVVLACMQITWQIPLNPKLYSCLMCT